MLIKITTGPITDPKSNTIVNDEITLADLAREQNYTGVIMIDGAPVKDSDKAKTLKELGVTEGAMVVYSRKNGGN